MQHVGVVVGALSAAIVAITPHVARADSVVTLCSTDTQAPSPGATVNLAQAIAGGGVVTFKCPAGSIIRITKTHTILSDTWIDGAGSIIFDGQKANRTAMFWGTDSRLTLGLVGLHILNGGTPKISALGILGGVVHGNLTVHMLRTVVAHSAFPVLLRGGSIRIEHSEFVDNSGTAVRSPDIEILDGSRFQSNDAPWSSRGGHVVIDHSSFTANRSPSRCLNGTLTIRHASFTGNTGTNSGGALSIECAATIEDSEFANNSAQFGGAIFLAGAARTIALRHVKLHDNTASFFGGAIYAQFWGPDLDLALRHVSFVDNRAEDGGAIEFEGAMGSNRTISGAAVAFVRNTATNYGGAIHMTHAGMKMSRGVFVGNQAGRQGGAISAFQWAGHTLELANSIVVKNRADSGGAFWGNGATFINTTIADNGSAAIWAVAARTPPPGSGPAPKSFPIRFVNSIIANDFTVPCGAAISSSPYQNLGNNMQFPGASCGADIATSYPALGAYYVPLFFSGALNGGNASICDAVPISHRDVYDVQRPLLKACSIGAVEGNVSHILNRKREGLHRYLR